MTSERERLLPCPFCGNDKNISVANERLDLSGGYFIACPECDASTGLRYACGEDPRPLLIEQWNRRALPAPADQVLVPKRLTRAMREVLDEEGWTWEDLLAAAEAITEAEYAELQAAPADQPPSGPKCNDGKTICPCPQDCEIEGRCIDNPKDQPTSQEPHGSSGSLPESGVEAGTQDAASAFEQRQRAAFNKIHPINDEVPGALREAFFELFRQGWAGASDYYGIVVDGFGPPDKRGYIERIRPNADASVVSAQHGASDNSEQDQPKPRKIVCVVESNASISAFWADPAHEGKDHP